LAAFLLLGCEADSGPGITYSEPEETDVSDFDAVYSYIELATGLTQDVGLENPSTLNINYDAATGTFSYSGEGYSVNGKMVSSSDGSISISTDIRFNNLTDGLITMSGNLDYTITMSINSDQSMLMSINTSGNISLTGAQISEVVFNTTDSIDFSTPTSTYSGYVKMDGEYFKYSDLMKY